RPRQTRRAIGTPTGIPVQMNPGGNSKGCWKRAKPAGARPARAENPMITILAGLSWSGVGLRAGAIAGALVVWFWTQSLIARKAAAKDGIGDVVHDLTSRWHFYFATNERAANGALIASSICIDLIGLCLI